MGVDCPGHPLHPRLVNRTTDGASGTPSPTKGTGEADCRVGLRPPRNDRGCHFEERRGKGKRKEDGGGHPLFWG